MISPKNTIFLLKTWTLAFFCIYPDNCFAIDQTTPELGNYFRVIWGLLIVLGIILILYGLLRKRFSLLSSSTDSDIKVLEIKPLMGKKALCLIQVRGQDFLLGISGDNISHLATLSKKHEKSFSAVLNATGKGESS